MGPLPGNCAQATLAVTATPAPPARPCKVIQLAGAPLSIADGALPALNCAVGKPTKQSSKKIHKGLVISTNPGAGATLTAGTVVNIVVSSGPPKKHKKKKKR
ncbi:MAG: PASTA domain-containing protein [Actinomycetota bacterium]|nr:PASTA domain-containing protein [Actinomycetota bacterium]